MNLESVQFNEMEGISVIDFEVQRLIYPRFDEEWGVNPKGVLIIRST